MRVCIIEEVANGFVVRMRGGSTHGALAVPEPQALRKALLQVQAFFLEPVEAGDSPTFPALPAIPGTGAEVTALEQKSLEKQPEPTNDAHLVQGDPDAATVRMQPRWAGPPGRPRV